MTATDTTTTTDVREAFAERLLGDVLAGLETVAVHLGIELGLYAALDAGGPATPGDLAVRAGIAPRYAREWLEQQAVTGVLGVDDPALPADRRTYGLAPAQREVLLDGDSPFHVAGVTGMFAGVAGVLPQLAAAYRSGGGVPYGDYGAVLRDGIAALNGPMFHGELAEAWLPAMPDVHERLGAAAAPRILDLGCGTGASTRALAAAYPRATVVGVDLDEASIARARQAAGTDARVSFRCADAAGVVADEQPFDLVTIFEALHDIGDPVGALRTARRACGDSGVVLVGDERVADEFTSDGDFLERFNYAWSVTHCLPATMAESPVEPNGTVLRAPTVHRWAGEAGFGAVHDLPVDNEFWRFYRLDPVAGSTHP